MRLPGPPPGTSATGEQDFRVWQRLAPLGLLLVGAGTAGLVLLNAGLSVFGEAVKRRALFEASARTRP